MNSKPKLSTSKRKELHQPTLEAFTKKPKKAERATPITIEYENVNNNNNTSSNKRVQSQLTASFGLQKPIVVSKEPAHWREVWDLIAQMRSETPMLKVATH